MEKLNIRIEDFFVLLTVLLFATGLVVIGTSDDVVIAFGLLLVLASVPLSLAARLSSCG